MSEARPKEHVEKPMAADIQLTIYALHRIFWALN